MVSEPDRIYHQDGSSLLECIANIQYINTDTRTDWDILEYHTIYTLLCSTSLQIESTFYYWNWRAHKLPTAEPISYSTYTVAGYGFTVSVIVILYTGTECRSSTPPPTKLLNKYINSL